MGATLARRDCRRADDHAEWAIDDAAAAAAATVTLPLSLLLLVLLVLVLLVLVRFMPGVV
jgi:hypothetical protein